MRKVRVIVVTGVSGAGKSTALRALEDLDFYCVDNLPVPLLPQLVAQLGEREDAAIVVDARAGAFLPEHKAIFERLRKDGHTVEVLFLDAADETLVRRFSETRRKHPLSGDDLRDGIFREREMLKQLREDATAHVDTGNLNVHQLKGVIQERYRRSAEKLSVTLLSFGFRHGLPVEADFVFDVRSLPNPYFVPELSAGTGEDEAVAAFVFAQPAAQALVGKIAELLGVVIPLAEAEGKAYLTVAVGCTGGRHRSVAVVRELQSRLRGGRGFTVRHRDLERRGRE